MSVWAVVRFTRSQVAPEFIATIKEILPSKEEAEREVARLNSLIRDGDDVTYFAQPTRYFPDGLGMGDPEQAPP